MCIRDSREGGYNSGRSSYGNNRPSYGNGGGQYNRPSRPNYDGPATAYSASPSGEGMSADGMKTVSYTHLDVYKRQKLSKALYPAGLIR